jgi:hypothetical protein
MVSTMYTDDLLPLSFRMDPSRFPFKPEILEEYCNAVAQCPV